MSKKEKERYVIIRTVNAGAFAGILVSREGEEVKLKNSRRLWEWSGAASLSQLAVNGTSNPSGCKFPVEIPNHEILGVMEIIDCTQKGINSIKAVPVWEV